MMIGEHKLKEVSARMRFKNDLGDGVTWKEHF